MNLLKRNHGENMEISLFNSVWKSHNYPSSCFSQPPTDQSESSVPPAPPPAIISRLINWAFMMIKGDDPSKLKYEESDGRDQILVGNSEAEAHPQQVRPSQAHHHLGGASGAAAAS